MAYNLKEEMSKKERFEAGHRLCAGCGAGIVCRAMMRAVDPEEQAVICNATSCLEVSSFQYPYTAWHDSYIHSAFENAAATASTVRRLSGRLQPENIQKLERISFADKTARGNIDLLSFPEWKQKTEYVFKLAQELNVTQKSPSPILDGNIIMKETGLPQGTKIGFILEKAFNAQLDGKFNNVSSGLKWLKKNLNNLNL